MLGTDDNVSDEQHFVFSNLPPSPAQKRLAVGIVLGLVIALYLVVGPFGGIQLGAVPSFVAIYTTAMFVIDCITAILLYAQFSILRSRAILLIASGYLFTALLIVPYLLAFPGVLAPDGLMGTLQTTAHLYLLWHCSFPLFVIAYALLKDKEPAKQSSQSQVGSPILKSVALTVTGAAAVAVFCIKTDAVLPRIMLDQTRFVPEWPWVVGAPIALLCATALVVLWFRRRSILDLFLMVVLCAYLIEVPPHYYPFPARFSTGWYAVRITSLISSGIVLVVLLHEITALYGGLLNAVRSQRRERAARLMTGDAVAASIAHEVRQPLPEGGTLELNIRTTSHAPPGVPPGGPWVVLEVSDTGMGMDAETMARIWEPFFTTKERGRGTGLGLATVYGIVSQSGGTILVRSQLGQGSCFMSYFPQVAAGAPATVTSRNVPSPRAGGETVLLVEDEDAVRRAVHAVLVDEGYDVLDASDGIDALHVLEQHGERIKAVVSDLVMPRMGGRELARRVIERVPGVRVLFISGHAPLSSGRSSSPTPPGGNPLAEAFLAKPFAPEALIDALRALLDRPALQASTTA